MFKILVKKFASVSNTIHRVPGRVLTSTSFIYHRSLNHQQSPRYNNLCFWFGYNKYNDNNYDDNQYNQYNQSWYFYLICPAIFMKGTNKDKTKKFQDLAKQKKGELKIKMQQEIPGEVNIKKLKKGTMIDKLMNKAYKNGVVYAYQDDYIDQKREETEKESKLINITSKDDNGVYEDRYVS